MTRLGRNSTPRSVRPDGRPSARGSLNETRRPHVSVVTLVKVF
jgi:hypothetical protein